MIRDPRPRVTPVPVSRRAALAGLLAAAAAARAGPAKPQVDAHRFDVTFVLIVAMVLLSMAIDALSRRLRRALRIETLPTRLSSCDRAAAR